MKIKTKDIRSKLGSLSLSSQPSPIVPFYEDIKIGYKEGKMTMETCTALSYYKTYVMAEGNPERFYTTVPFALFSNLIKNMSSEYVDINVVGNSLRISTDTGNYDIATTDWKAFPIMDLEGATPYSFDTSGMIQGVISTSWALDRSTVSEPLKSISIKDGEVACCSMGPFSIYMAEIHPDISFTVHNSAISCIKDLKGSSPKFRMSDKRIFFIGEDYVLSIIKSDVNYPDYRTPTNIDRPYAVDLYVPDIKMMISRLWALSPTCTTISIDINDDGLTLSVDDVNYGNFGKDTIYMRGCDHANFNLSVKSMHSAISAITEDHVTMHYKDAQTSVMLSSDNQETILGTLI